MRKRWRGPFADTSFWNTNLIILIATVFLERFGQGIVNAVNTNFFVDVLGLSGAQVLWLTGFREIPGLSLMFVAALVMHLPLVRRAMLSLILMGIGYGLYVLVGSYTAVVAVAIIASLGFHNWSPVEQALGMGLAPKGRSGEVLGTITSVASLAAIAGMGVVALLAAVLPLRAFYALGGVVIIVAAYLVTRLPMDAASAGKAMPRMLLKRRYGLYYILTFFEGSRMQVFGAFGTLILVQNYGLDTRAISLLLLTSSVVNLIVVPRFGKLIDRLGERLTLTGSYVLLALCFIGYATVHNALFLCAMVIGINLLVSMHLALTTYVNRIAPPEELSPTLSAGMSINHVSSVGMSLVAGSLLQIVGYETLCYGAAGIILASVPFALAIRTPASAPQPSLAGAE
jgi:predicted MFS family arabinose efflux permease